MIETLPKMLIPAAELGEGRADPVRCASVALKALGGAAGAGFALASLTLEMGPGEASGAIEVQVRVDKRTRAVVFATAEAWTGVGAGVGAGVGPGAGPGVGPGVGAGTAMIFTARGLYALRE